MRHATLNRGWTIQILLIVLAMTALATSVAKAQPQYRIEDAKVYVKMEFWKAPGAQAAEAWHFDPNNNDIWTQLPNNPTPPDVRPRAQFKVKDLFRHDLMPDPYVWFVAVDKIRVVAGSPSNFANVSGNPSYTEMIDRMVFKADPNSTEVIVYDPCGERSWPIFTGSELTPYTLFPHPTGWEGGYGMKMNKEGLLESANWLWKNPAGIEESDVYIEFTLFFDMDAEVEWPLLNHRKVRASWISADSGCGYTFCLPEGQETAVKIGTPFAEPDAIWSELVVAVPHVLDHTATLQLYWQHNGVNTLLIDSAINNSTNHHTAHKCLPDGGEIAWHNHSSAAAGHLPVGGLIAWRGDHVFNNDGQDEIFAAATFNIPSHTSPNPAPTNHRALYLVFWRGSGEGGN